MITHRRLVATLAALVLVCSSALFPSPLHASTPVDWDIICATPECTVERAPPGPLFSITNVLPGQKFTKTIRIENAFKKDTCYLHVQVANTNPATQSLFPYLRLSLSQAGGLSTTGLLPEFTKAGGMLFDTLPNKKTHDYLVTVELPSATVNNAQGATAKFDINLTIQCLSGPLPTPVPSPTPTPTPSPLPTPSPAATPSPTPTPCSAQPPEKAPELRIDKLDPLAGTIALSWTKSPHTTEYWVEFATTDQFNQYRHQGIIARNYLLHEVNFPASYYIRVIPLNDCAIGPTSNIMVAQSETVRSEAVNVGTSVATTAPSFDTTSTPSAVTLVNAPGSILGAQAEDPAATAAGQDTTPATVSTAVTVAASFSLLALLVTVRFMSSNG